MIELLLALAAVWFGASVLLLWRMSVLLRRASLRLERLESHQPLDLERHNENLAELLTSIRAFMQQSTDTLEAKADQLRALIAEAERLAQTQRQTQRGASPPISTPAPRKADPAPRPKPNSGASGNDTRRAEILARIEQGDGIDDVARDLGMSRNEVALVARLRGTQ